MKKTKFSLLVILSLFLMNCQKDDLGDSSNVPTAKNYTVESKTITQLKSDTKFKNSISPFLAKASTGKLETRSILEDKNEFTIDSTEVKVIKGLKGYTSYTFGILREFVKDDSFENIVFEYDDNSSIPKVSVIKYAVDLPTQNLYLAEVYLLDFLTGARQNAMELCWSITVTWGTYCPHDGHHTPGTTQGGGCIGGWTMDEFIIEICDIVTPSSPDTYLPIYAPPGGFSSAPIHGHGGSSTGGTPSTSPIPLNTPAYNRKKLLSKLTPEGMAYFFASSEATQGNVIQFLTGNDYSNEAFKILVAIITEAEGQNTSIDNLLNVINSFSDDRQCQGNKATSILFEGSSAFREMLKDELLRTMNIAVVFEDEPVSFFQNPTVAASTNANFGGQPHQKFQ